jgi:hypothetical protein
MALDTYDNLVLSVSDWIHRSDLSGKAADFITLAEARIKALLKTRLQSLTASLPAVAGTAYAMLPADLLHVRSISVPNVRPAMDYVSPDQFNADFADQRSGSPYKYTIIGDRVYFGPIPDASYALALVYEAKFLPLGVLQQTNSLLTNWPNIYLWGALKEAAKYSRNNDVEDRMNNDFLSAVDDANKLEWNVPGPLRMRTDTYTP